MLIVECCVCGDRRDPVIHKWFTPTKEDRIRTRKQKKSHGYCEDCSILIMKDEGMSNSEIKDMFLASYNKLTRR